jgi:hypothetical protein
LWNLSGSAASNTIVNVQAITIFRIGSSEKRQGCAKENRMTSWHLIAALAFVLSIAPSITAQSTPPQDSAKAEQAKKAQEELKKKGLALLEEVIRESRSLRLPENRIRIQLAAADLLWPVDEKRARSLFKEVISSYDEFAGLVERDDPQYENLIQLPFQLRQEILPVFARRDAKLALDFLRASRGTNSPKFMAYYGQVNVEAQLEIRLAVEVSNKDAGEALKIAEESLGLGVDQETVNFVYNLQSKNKEAADKFLRDVIGKLKAEDFAKNPAAFYAALNLVRPWLENNPSATARLEEMGPANLPLPALDRRAVQDLTNALVKAAMGGGPNRQGEGFTEGFTSMEPNWLTQLQPLMPGVEKLVPAYAPALRQRMAELEKANLVVQNNPWARYQEVINKGTAEDLLEASKNAPPEMQGNLYQQAAWKAFNQGDIEGARGIIMNKISDPGQRKEMMANIDRQMVSRASEQNKFDEARALINRLPSVEERVNYLCQIAMTAAAKGDKATALRLINEAQAMLSNKPQNYMQLQAQLQIAGACGAAEANCAAAILESVIDQLGELAAAAEVLNGFDIQQYFREGEFILGGGNNMGTVIQQVSEQVGPLAIKDFDRARSLGERFQRIEMRVKVSLHIAQAAISNEIPPDAEDGGTVGLRLGGNLPALRLQ